MALHMGAFECIITREHVEMGCAGQLSHYCIVDFPNIIVAYDVIIKIIQDQGCVNSAVLLVFPST